jgi:hypothetical protein
MRTNQLKPIDFTTVPNLSWDALLPVPFHFDDDDAPAVGVVPTALEHAASDTDSAAAATTVISRDLFMANLS